MDENKRRFLLVAEKEFLQHLKIEAAKSNETMTDFIVKAVLERIERLGKKCVK